MDELEDNLKVMLHRAKNYSIVEFFNERDNLNDMIEKITEKLDNMGTYLPCNRLKFDKDMSLDDMIPQIQDSLEKLINKNFEDVDQEFAFENYKYIMEEVQNPNLKNIYKLLGPFDFSHYNEKAERAEEMGKVNDGNSEKSGALSEDEEKRVP